MIGRIINAPVMRGIKSLQLIHDLKRHDTSLSKAVEQIPCQVSAIQRAINIKGRKLFAFRHNNYSQ